MVSSALKKSVSAHASHLHTACRVRIIYQCWTFTFLHVSWLNIYTFYISFVNSCVGGGAADSDGGSGGGGGGDGGVYMWPGVGVGGD